MTLIGGGRPVGRLLVEMALSMAPEGQVGSGRVGRLVLTGPDMAGAKRWENGQLVCPVSDGRLAAVVVVEPGVSALSSPVRVLVMLSDP